MKDVLIITTERVVYHYLRSIFGAGCVKISFKQTSSFLLSSDKKFEYAFFDVANNQGMSIETIEKLNSKAKKTFFLIANNDKLQLRTFPFYMFNGFLEYPINRESVLSLIKKEDHFEKTRKIISIYNKGDFDNLVANYLCSVDNEHELFHMYDSLLSLNKLPEAEDLVTDFYKINKIPKHPKISILREIHVGENFEKIQSTIRDRPLIFCNSIDEQIILNSFGVIINNEYKSIISKSLGRRIIYLNEVLNSITDLLRDGIINNEGGSDIINFLLFRDLLNYEKMSKLNQSIIISLSLSLNDYNSLTFILSKKNKFKPIIKAIVKKVLERKISTISTIGINHKSDFDNNNIHLEFLRGYKNINYSRDKELLLASVYKISLVDKGDKLKSTIIGLSDYYRTDEVIKSYDNAQYVRFSQNSKSLLFNSV